MTSIVLVRLSAMGDLVQSLTAVASLRAVRDDVRVTLVTQRPWLPLLEGLAGIDEVVPFDRRGGLAAVLRVCAALRRRRHDWAFDLQGNWKSALLTRLSGARERVGMAADWRQEPASRLLLRRTVAGEGTPHPARAAWRLVREVAPGAPVASEAEVARERACLRELGVDASRPFRVVVVGGAGDPRSLAPEVVAAIAAEPEPVVHLLGPAERDLPAPAGITLRHGPGELRRLVALGALLAAAGGEVVGPDQGASHVLLAAGASGRVLFGSQDPQRTAPPTARALVGIDELSCRPCRSRRCRHPDGPVCMVAQWPAGFRRVSLGLPPVGASGPGPWPAEPSRDDGPAPRPDGV